MREFDKILPIYCIREGKNRRNLATKKNKLSYCRYGLLEASPSYNNCRSVYIYIFVIEDIKTSSGLFGIT